MAATATVSSGMAEMLYPIRIVGPRPPRSRDPSPAETYCAAPEGPPKQRFQRSYAQRKFLRLKCTRMF